MACVILATLGTVSVVNAWVAGERVLGQIEDQLREIARTLSRSSFPLTSSVLQQMRGLAGADFVVTGPTGDVLAASEETLPAASLLEHAPLRPLESLALDRRVKVRGATYFHVAVDLQRPWPTGQSVYLHFFYPEAAYRDAWWDAVLPPLGVGFVALAVVVLISHALAMRLVRPLDRLRDQVDRVARGQFVPVAVPPRDDELRDLAIAVNRMTEKLAHYEADVRRQERLRTLDQLGGGIAHQLRNSVTGCRMAVDLHQRHCPLQDEESLQVAVQQLGLMDEYVRRFLALGKPATGPLGPVDLGATIDKILPLLRPKARHLNVVLRWEPPPQPVLVRGDADALAQVGVNLVLNAIEAAAEMRAAGIARREPQVVVCVAEGEDSRPTLAVHDSGPGPAEGVRDQLFEPLISDKADGVGLGLALVKEVVDRHGGTIRWCRQDMLTRFSVEFPRCTQEAPDVDVAGCR
ncbi:MAG: PAS domain-containing sensor histidine kinase [Pirellulaceae bacterium]